MVTCIFGCVGGQYHAPGRMLGMDGDRVTVPLPFYVIEHSKGVGLFDCGLHTDIANPDDPYLNGLRAFGLDVTAAREDSVTHHLERLDIDPGRVRWVVLSHLHFDHAGGLHQLPNATIVVQRREWKAGFDEDIAAKHHLPKRFFDLGHEVMQIDGEHDLFGDGSVTCIPTFGHTPGHQSMRVRSEFGDHILVGDACNNHQIIGTRHFPAPSDPRHEEINRSLDALLARREAGTVLVYGHDPEQWGEVPVLPCVRA